MKAFAPDRRKKPNQPMTLDVLLAASIPEPNTGCFIWLKAANSTSGYGVVRHENRLWMAHRLAYSLNHQVQIEPHIDICHRCDNRLCVNPDHLFAGTRSDNMQDCKRKGRLSLPMLTGEALPQAKLSEQEVRAIRADTRARSAIAEDYGVHRDTIKAVQSRQTWRHVGDA
jgi:hypothetical protein